MEQKGGKTKNKQHTNHNLELQKKYWGGVCSNRMSYIKIGSDMYWYVLHKVVLDNDNYFHTVDGSLATLF